MRLVDFLRLLTLPLFLVALIMLRSRRRLLRQLQEQNATTPERAIAPDAGHLLGAWQLRRLRSAGVLTDGAGDTVYLSIPALRVYRKRRRILALAIFAVICAVLLVSLWLSGKGP